MLLYVEDTLAIAESVVAYLETSWFRVDWCTSWAAWLEKALHSIYECVILDVMLPDMDGFAVCREIRKVKQVPVIMTTAKWTITDKSTWFEGGADDYLVKPFPLEELVMRIKACVKRYEVNDVLHIWDVDLYLDENRYVKAGQAMALTPKEEIILLELLATPGITVSRSDIIDAVRWHDALFENNDAKLDVYIATLRKKLGKGLIETVKGVGYRLKRM